MEAGTGFARVDNRKWDLEDRFDNIGWGLLFLLVAALALPNGTAEYVSVAFLGACMIGLNVARRVARVPVRWFTIVFGVTALTAGILALIGVHHVDVFALFFVFLGSMTIVAAIVRRPRQSLTA